jgi:hypothetical protein
MYMIYIYIYTRQLTPENIDKIGKIKQINKIK